ncbi:monosaccharide ABC transporter substrate-binding protein (CUT2 family) [Trinickia symbiotica]|nr:ABC transporter substrate-binding protein [Trinickia symbiotica]PPK45983.1 monosaccharide ABC transporter substrate-binding protein (CUT2 family) [Trinickia symbiotica]
MAKKPSVPVRFLHMRRRALGALFGALMLSVIAAPSAYATKDHPVVALLPGVVDPFYFTMYHGAQKAAAEDGVQLLFQLPKSWNTTEQVPILKAFIAKHPDAILISPVDAQQLIEPLTEAKNAGIKVITVDTFIGTGRYQTGSGNADFPRSFIASDNEEGGRIAARTLAKAIGEKGVVFCESLKPGVSSTDARVRGFQEEMKKYPKIKVLQTLYSEDDANKAVSDVSGVLAREPGLSGVFGTNTFSGKGVSQALQMAGKSGKVKLIVFDAVPGIDKDLKSGLVDYAIAQRPADMGYYGVKYAVDAIRGKPIPKEKDTGFVVMDKSNIDNPNVKQFIYSN